MDGRYDALKAHTDEQHRKLKGRMDERIRAMELRILDLEKHRARLDGFQEVVSEWSCLRPDPGS